MRTLLIALPVLLLASPAFAQAQGGPTPPPPPADKPAEAPAGPAAPAPEKVELSEQQPAATQQSAVTANVATASPAPAAGVVAMQGATPAAPKNEPASTSANASQRGSDVAAADNSWKLEYHGYLRAPMRVGLASRQAPGLEQGPQAEEPGSSTMHYPVLPDDQYLNWQFTSHNKKDWAEMFFTYGNSWAKGTLALQGFNFTDAAWADQVAQFGISQGYVELTPDLGFENVRLSAKGGSFWARYGMAGKWDAGEYDTYLFGRTHAMGGLVHLDYDIDDATTLWFEAGVGTKRPDPSQFNNARFTMLYHGHAGLKLGSDIEFSTHLMWLSSTEEDRVIRKVNTIPTGGTAISDPYNPPNYPSSLMGLPSGRMFTTGLDARLEIGALGYLYAGYSHIGAKNALSIAPAVEVLHAFGGGQYQLGLTDNYFGPGCRAVSADDTNTMPGGIYGTPTGSCSMGTGSVNSILAQYEFSLANFQQISSGGQKFWGEGTDLKATLYGMVNFVNSDVKQTLSTNGKTVYDGVMKLKYGADLQYAAIPWVTFALRADRVQPNNHIPEQSFSILSPRVVFKSKWVTREQISIQYSRYIYNQRECSPVPGSMDPFSANPALSVANPTGGIPGGHSFNESQYFCTQPPAAPSSSEGFGSHWENQDAGLRGAPATRPDVNVVSVTASMWW